MIINQQNFHSNREISITDFLLKTNYIQTSKHKLANWYIFLMQNLIQKTNATDASGNPVFGDIGVYTQQEVCYYLLMLPLPSF